MTGWRWAIAALLALLIAAPLLLPVVELVDRGAVWHFLSDARFFKRFGNTLLLATCTMVLAVPVGVAAAVLLFRTDLPGRHFFRGLAALGLFIPLPVIVAAWQTTFGPGSWLPFVFGQPSGYGPCLEGVVPAIVINASAVVPAVILLVGHSLTWVEAELEEDALLVVGPWRMLWHVTLRRCRSAIGAAALWVFLFTMADNAVTEAMKVATFAEEINVQFNLGDDALARAVALALPWVLLLVLLMLWLVPRLDRSLPPLPTIVTWPRDIPLRRTRWYCLGVLSLFCFVVVVIPLGSLVWKVGLQGTMPHWSATEAGMRIASEFRLYGLQVGGNLLWAGLAGLLTTLLALLACWAAVDCSRFRLGILALVVLAWSLPGPVIGLGLKLVIQQWIAWFPGGVAEEFLYQRSPLSVLWAHVLRFFPLAVALLWPVVRTIPRELREAARLDGARPIQEFFFLIRPLTATACLWAMLVVSALSLGELAASSRVETPGSETFARLLFDRLHYGSSPDVAALCLVLLAWLAVIGTAYSVAPRGHRSSL